MAIGEKDRKAANSFLPAISLSFISLRRKSHSKHNNTNKPSHIPRKSISFLPSIRKSKRRSRSKPDPDTHAPSHDPASFDVPNHTIHPQPVQSDKLNASQPQFPRTIELTEADISAMREAFNVIQSGPNGRVSPSDLGFLMRSLGANPTQTEINSILAQEHLTSSFSFNKFTDVMSRHLRPEPEQCDEPRLHDLFKLFDADNTGSITVSELRNILTSVGERLQPSEFDEWIREVGVSSNDLIRYEEFVAPLKIA